MSKSQDLLKIKSINDLELVIQYDKELNEINEILESKCFSINKCKKLFPKQTKERIALMLAEFIDYSGINNRITPEHVSILVDDIISVFGRIKLSEVNFVLKRARTGYYGELYNNIGPIKIIGWFRDYYEERLSEAARISQDKHSSLKGSNFIERSPENSDTKRLGEISKAIQKNFPSE